MFSLFSYHATVNRYPALSCIMGDYVTYPYSQKYLSTVDFFGVIDDSGTMSNTSQFYYTIDDYKGIDDSFGLWTFSVVPMVHEPLNHR